MNCLRHELRARIGGCNSSNGARSARNHGGGECRREFMTACRQFMECGAREFILSRHFEQMKALVVPLGNSREISIPRSTDQGALTEIQKCMGARLKHLKDNYRRKSDPSRLCRAARVKPCGAQDDGRKRPCAR